MRLEARGEAGRGDEAVARVPLTAHSRQQRKPTDAPVQLTVQRQAAEAQSRCTHRGRSFFEDQLRIEGRISRIGTSSVVSRYRVYREETSLVAEGQLVSVCIQRETKLNTPCPAELREAVERYEGAER